MKLSVLKKKRKLYTTSDYSVFISFIFISFIERRSNFEPISFFGTPLDRNIIIIGRNWINFDILSQEQDSISGINRIFFRNIFSIYFYLYLSQIRTCVENALHSSVSSPFICMKYISYMGLAKILCDSVNRNTFYYC